MKTLNNLLFFSQQYGSSLKKKWLSLLLLFIVPILLIGAIMGLVVLLLLPTEQQPITLSIVDNDQTEESKMMAQLVLLTVADNRYLSIISEDEDTALRKLHNQEITSVLRLPQGFTEDLYAGRAVELELVGSAARKIDSIIILELINSLTRYIESAQANILTIYDYAKQMDFSEEELRVFMYEKFMDFTMFTLAKGNLLWTEQLDNLATATPKVYYSIVMAFVLQSIWLLGIYLLLRKDESAAISVRLRLLNVTVIQMMLARAIWAGTISMLVMSGISVWLNKWLQLNLVLLDFSRVFIFMLLYSVCYLLMIMFVELIIPSMKLSLLTQVLLFIFLIICSGAIIPIVYFPLPIQSFCSITFSYMTFTWIIDIAMEGRNYAEYRAMLSTILALGVMVTIVWQVKARWQV